MSANKTPMTAVAILLVCILSAPALQSQSPAEGWHLREARDTFSGEVIRVWDYFEYNLSTRETRRRAIADVVERAAPTTRVAMFYVLRTDGEPQSIVEIRFDGADDTGLAFTRRDLSMLAPDAADAWKTLKGTDAAKGPVEASLGAVFAVASKSVGEPRPFRTPSGGGPLVVPLPFGLECVLKTSFAGGRLHSELVPEQ